MFNARLLSDCQIEEGYTYKSPDVNVTQEFKFQGAEDTQECANFAYKERRCELGCENFWTWDSGETKGCFVFFVPTFRSNNTGLGRRLISGGSNCKIPDPGTSMFS